MEREELFRHTIRDLIEFIDSRPFEEYETLKSSVLLRKMLVDSDPLMNQINRQRRKRIRFEVVNHGPNIEDMVPGLPAPMLHAYLDGISPRVASTIHGTESLDRDRFLAHPIMRLGGPLGSDERVTVYDAIVQVANVEGGVHPGMPKTELQERLAEVNRGFKFNNVGAICRTLYGIADVTAATLAPLLTAAQREQTLRELGVSSDSDA